MEVDILKFEDRMCSMLGVDEAFVLEISAYELGLSNQSQ